MNSSIPFLSGKKVLVVDDEKDLRELISEELREFGAEISESENLIDALKKLETSFFDFILTDMKMPGGSGEEILKKVNQGSGKRSIVVILTGQSDISSEEIFDLGADALFTKPYEMQLLTDALKFLSESPEKRWTRAHPRLDTDFPVVIRFESVSDSINTKTINIGRGGMCIELSNECPSIGQIVNFSLQSNTGICLEGVASCKWVNTQKDKVFVGLEFLSVSKAAIDEIITYIRKNSPRSYIPKRKF